MAPGGHPVLQDGTQHIPSFPTAAQDDSHRVPRGLRDSSKTVQYHQIPLSSPWRPSKITRTHTQPSSKASSNPEGEREA
eukprot:4822759-Pyramimonas_sp.AAC.1